LTIIVVEKFLIYVVMGLLLVPQQLMRLAFVDVLIMRRQVNQALPTEGESP